MIQHQVLSCAISVHVLYSSEVVGSTLQQFYRSASERTVRSPEITRPYSCLVDNPAVNCRAECDIVAYRYWLLQYEPHFLR